MGTMGRLDASATVQQERSNNGKYRVSSTPRTEYSTVQCSTVPTVTCTKSEDGIIG